MVYFQKCAVLNAQNGGNIVKKLVSAVLFAVFFLMTLNGTVFACDFCQLSQGISPLQSLAGAGIRVNERYTLINSVYRGTEKIDNPGSKETFWTTEITGFYSPSEDLMLLAVFPVRNTKLGAELIVNEDGTVSSDDTMKGGQSGLGDVTLLGRYTFFRRHTIDSTTAVAGVFGVKLPTGATDGKIDNGTEFLDSHFQLGTGSTDFLAGLSLSHSVQRFSLSANLLAAFTSEGAFGVTKHQFGNSLNYDITAKYRVYPGEPSSVPQLFLALGLNGELRGKETADGVEDPNSGGHTVYLSPGVQVVVAPRWVFELSYQQAVYHSLNGIQVGENCKVNGGVTYLF